MKPVDVVVAGSGMAGMTAALAAALKGKQVRLVSRGAGSLAVSGGTVDVLGYVEGKAVVGNPLDSIHLLPEEHPYRRMGGAEAVRRALDFFTGQCAGHGLAMEPDKAENTWLPTIVGTFKPSYLCPGTEGRAALTRARTVYVVGVPGLKDCHAGLVARELGKRRDFSGIAVEPLHVSNPFGSTHRSITSLDLARYADTHAGEVWLARALAPKAEEGVAFLLPPLLGVEHFQAVRERLTAALGCALVEMLVPPPGVGGLRLRRVLLAALAAAGVIVEENVRVAGARVENKRCISLVCDAPDRQRELRAASFIIATGGFLGGGHFAEPGRAREEIFGLDLGAPPAVEDWSLPDIFQPQPYARLGVTVNKRLNPVGKDGDVLFENVFFAGRSLAGYDFVTEKSGHGVAISSGVHAAEQT